MNPMALPAATSDITVVAKYGYTMNKTPAARCGHRCCFLPYVNSTNPSPLGMRDNISHVGSNVTIEGRGQRDSDYPAH